jgi:hypothetical protein
MKFTLYQRLQEDTIEVVRLKLSRVLLMNDSSFPWLILVPEREGISEIHQLGTGDRSLLRRNSRCFGNNPTTLFP